MKPEPFVQMVMLEKYGLQFEKIPETSEKTPDFSLSLAGELVMVAEVKNLPDIFPSEDTGWHVRNPEPNIFEYERVDNGPSRVGRVIYNAFRQIKTYACLRCVAIINDDLADVSNLDEIIFGYFAEVNLSGGVLRLSSDTRPYRSLKEVVPKIDLFIWIDRNQNKDRPESIHITACSRRGDDFAVKYLHV